jgi:HAD superfamily hydrolase (TIGR01549 family)
VLIILINTIVFDADGTLYDETHAKIKAELLTAEFISNKSNVSLELIYNTFREVKDQITSDFIGMPDRNDRKKWYEETLQRIGVISITKEEASEYYWQIIYHNIKPYFDLMYVIPKLAKNYKLFILTDELLEIQRKKLDRLGLKNFFVKVISSDQIGETKPSQKLFNYALNMVGELPSDVIIVGDNPSKDIRGGNSIGMHTAWLKRGKYFYYSQNNDEKPDIIFNNYIQLDNKIKSLEALTK